MGLVPRSGGFEHLTIIDVAAAELSGPLTADVAILDVAIE
jgi:hypothetical protein